MRTRFGIILVLLILLVAIIAQNTEDVTTIKALFWSTDLPNSAAFGMFLAIGTVVGLLLGRPWRRRKPAAPPPPAKRPVKKDEA